MIRGIILLSFLLLIGISADAQKSVMLKIDHMFNGEQVEYDQWMDADNGSYVLDWVSYYLSDFTLIQSDVSEFNIANSFALIKMDEEGYYEIGKADVADVSGMKFHIGVPESLNHNDPASWPEGHPLNYQTPGMHWGWAGGYIFFVFNGKYDADHNTNPGELFDMEAIGDPLYRDYEMELSTGVEVTEDVIWINIQADYYSLTNGINMPYSNHGNDPTLAKMMDNIVDHSMFTEAIVSSNHTFVASEWKAVCFPNPSDGNFTLSLENKNDVSPITMHIFNSLGQLESSIEIISEENDIDVSLNSAGSYYLVLEKEGQVIDRQKLVVFK